MDKEERLIRISLFLDEFPLDVINLYAPNNGKERKKDNFLCPDNTGDATIPVIISWDCNCTMNKHIVRYPKHKIYDVGTLELKSLVSQNDIEDIWCIRNPDIHHIRPKEATHIHVLI